MNRLSPILPIRSAALFCAALVLFLAVGWLAMARVEAQVPTHIGGVVVNGTANAPAASVSDLPVTLFQITETGPVTRTTQTDGAGSFSFTDVLTDATAYFTRVDYAGIRYYSDILPPELAGTTPITMTVYETQTLPANFTLDQLHLILDIQPKHLNGLVLLQMTNPTDRAFFMPLPVPTGASDVQFNDVRETTRLVRTDDGKTLYPILPTTSELLYGLVLPYTPPDLPLQLPLPVNVANINLLVSVLGGVSVSGSNLTPGEPFTAQSGQQYAVFTAAGQRAGETFRATISNLPGVDNTPTVQNLLLVVGGFGALALLAFPVYKRRTMTAPAATNARVARLQAIAQLDDEFAAGALPEDEYLSERAELKAELLQNETQPST